MQERKDLAARVTFWAPSILPRLLDEPLLRRTHGASKGRYLFNL
jgi:hypothetical protein